jgi:predicted amino acid-binding ACT domain protein
LAWAFARQAQLGAEVVARRDKDTVVQSVSGRLAHYTISFVDVGETLLQKLFYEIAEVDLKVHGTYFQP